MLQSPADDDDFHRRAWDPLDRWAGVRAGDVRFVAEPDEFMTVAEVAGLKLHPRTIRNWIGARGFRRTESVGACGWVAPI